MRYRKEIDGLRAVAVLPVLFFHAGFSIFSGGYVGVDIFFVISGYLITSIILEEINQEKFSILSFYERRARRILPALSLVLIFTIVAAYIYMPPTLLKEFSQSLVSVSAFISNVFFFLESGYFSSASDEMPLLHTWSLAVEEQYYVIFPLVVGLFWVRSKKAFIAGVLIISLISLAISQYLANQGQADLNFYLIQSRAWELLFGSMIALFSLDGEKTDVKLRELLSIGGMAMIIYSIVFFDKNTPFPSLYALVPVVGTCLVIIYTRADSIVGHVLASKLFIFIGLISYSLYLWHQPIFAFLRITSIGEPDQMVFSIAIIISILLAFISWKYIEAPFRDRNKTSKALIFSFSGLSIAFFISLGLLGHIKQGFPQRFGDALFSGEDLAFTGDLSCHAGGHDYLKPVDACRTKEDASWAVLGDSHGNMLVPSLGKLLERKNEGLIHLTFTGCPPAMEFDVRSPGCSAWTREATDYVANNDQVTDVLVAYRLSYYMYGDHLNDYPELPDNLIDLNLEEKYAEYSKNEVRELYWQSFVTIIETLRKAGKNVHILYPVPELPVDVSKAIAPKSIFDDEPIVDLNNTTSIEYYNERNEFILNKLNSLEYGPGLNFIDPAGKICNADYCSTVLDGKLLYRDDNHVNNTGADLILEQLD